MKKIIILILLPFYLSGQTEILPDGNITTGAWTSQFTAGHWPAIDEGQPGNGPTDYIFASTANNNYECSLEDVADPNSSGTHTIYANLWANNGAATFTITLLQGTTTITTWTQAHSAAWTAYSHDLTTGEANSITDYDDLRLRVSHNQNAFKAVSAMSFEVPAAVSNTLQVNGINAEQINGDDYDAVNDIAK